MEKIKNFFKSHWNTIAFIGSLVLLSITLLYIACPDISVNVRVEESHKITNKY